MILNGYSLLSGAVAGLQLLLGLCLAVFGACLWLSLRRATRPIDRAQVEERSYALILQAYLLTGLCLCSWPLLYLVLKSYVPEWPGVMCIYGVTRVGIGSYGPSGCLPALIDALQILKPALVLLTGAWLVIYAVHRSGAAFRLLGTLLATLAAIGCLSAIDAAFELAYLSIPKRNQALASGCCPSADRFTAAVAGAAHGAPKSSLALPATLWLVSNLIMLSALERFRGRRTSGAVRVPEAAALPLTGALSLAATIDLLRNALSPVLLATPGHACLYDLMERSAPITAAVGLAVAAALFTAWIAVGVLFAKRERVGPAIYGLTMRMSAAGQIAAIASILLILPSLLRVR